MLCSAGRPSSLLMQPPSFFIFGLILLRFLSNPPEMVWKKNGKNLKKGKKNHIFLSLLPEVALACAHTAAIFAFHTPLTRRGTDRRCSSTSLKWLPSHAGWLDPPPPPTHTHTHLFIPRLKRGRIIFNRQIMMTVASEAQWR